MSYLGQFAAESTTAKSDIFTALGIDWRLLILQIIAFLILVALLGKFVYPWLIKSVDERQAAIEAAAKAAATAQEAAERNNQHVIELLAEARKEATEIISNAKQESSEIVSTSQKKAIKTAEQIVADAHERIEKDVANAKKQLHNETLELVSLATGRVVGQTLSKTADNDLIAKAVKAAK